MKCFLLALMPLFFYSCAEYQYLTVSGVDITKNNKQEFVVENDTLELTYHFKDDNGKILISVFNRTNEPLVVDWWKSAITIDEKVYSYYNPNAILSARVSSDTLLSGTSMNGGIYLADVNGDVHLNETSQFIPSNARINKEMIVLSIDTLKNLPEHIAYKDTISLPNNLVLKYKRMSFEQGQSPLKFRSYITFRIGKGHDETELSIENRFYVSEVWKIASRLNDIPDRIIARGDMIFLGP